VEQKEKRQSVIIAESVVEERETAPPFRVELHPSKVKCDREVRPVSVEKNRVQDEE
jgi:hypothetical protein